MVNTCTCAFVCLEAGLPTVPGSGHTGPSWVWFLSLESHLCTPASDILLEGCLLQLCPWHTAHGILVFQDVGWPAKGLALDPGIEMSECFS